MGRICVESDSVSEIHSKWNYYEPLMELYKNVMDNMGQTILSILSKFTEWKIWINPYYP